MSNTPPASAADDASARAIPLTLLTGFLGSGKTTLLNQLVRQPALAGCAVIVNELGQIGLDHHLVQRVDDEVLLLESGCLCCSVRGELATSLRDLFMRRLRRELPALSRVLIETTGLADPAPILHTLMRDFFLAPRYRLDGVVCVVDAQHAPHQLAQHPEALRQIGMADRLVLTKTDLVQAPALAALRMQLAQINPGAGQEQADFGRLPAERLLGLGLYDPQRRSADARRWLAEAEVAAQAAVRNTLGGRGVAPPPHAGRVQAQALRFEQPLSWGSFSSALDLLQAAAGERLLRLKALVAVAGEPGPRVVHAVGSVRYPDAALPQWPDADHATRVVIIGHDLPPATVAAFRTLCGGAADAAEDL